MTVFPRSRLTSLILWASLAGCSASGPGGFPAIPELKVMSYNVHFAVGMDGERDLERIARVIRSADPDLVGLQEVGNRAMADELAERTGTQSVFGPAKGNENDYGDALLSKHPFEWVGVKRSRPRAPVAIRPWPSTWISPRCTAPAPRSA